MSAPLINPIKENEISLILIAKFFLDSWKSIFFFGVLGVVASTIYLHITPKQYEAAAQVKLIQVMGNSGVYSQNNLEDPTLTLSRFKSPLFYSKEDYMACSVDSTHPEGILKLLKFTMLDGVNSVLIIKVRMESSVKAEVCINSIINTLKKTQKNILSERIKPIKDQLKSFKLRENELKKMIANSTQSKLDSPTVYMMYFDEIRFVGSEISRLESIVLSTKNQDVELVFPLTVKDTPVWPIKRVILGLGLFIGFILGLLFALTSKFLFAVRN